VKRWISLIFAALLLIAMTALGAESPLYLNPDATPEERTEDLLSRMTLKEKLGQVTQIEIHRLMRHFWNKGPLDSGWLETVIVDYGVGSILSGGDGAPDNNSPEEWVEMTNQIQEWSTKTRLKIPILYGIDAVHGYNSVVGATIYPYNIGLAAAFNEELTYEYTALTAEEIAATGIHWTFAPVLDVAVDPRWGRTHETLGEDPYLVSILGKRQIEGFQRSGKIIACAKHFTGYSAPKNGMDRQPAEISERDLREIHFPPYQAAIKAGVGSIMINSGAVNGVPTHASKWLLTDILRKEMGFKGLAVSDWEDVGKLVNYHRTAANMEEALATAYNAGMDLNMVPMDVTVIDSLEKLVKDGRLSVERIDDAVRNILRVKFRLGLFEQRIVDPKEVQKAIGSQKSKELARTLARQTMTLLGNEKKMLPLSKKIKSLLVTGPSADSLSRLCGGWTIGWQGAQEYELSGETVLEAIRKKVPSAKVTYIDDARNAKKLVKDAKAADAVVVVVGEKPYAEQHGDNTSLRLSQSEEKIITVLQKAKIPFVLVVAAGRPLILPGEEKAAPAILWAYLPGTEGGPAIADVLFGDYNPSGRLPITFPRNTEKFPVTYYYREAKDADPIYPFGFGLSYTQFSYADLKVSKQIQRGQTAQISVKVKNIGAVAGDHVVLLFLKDEKGTVTPLNETLQGFTRVSLKPGEEKSVSFNLTAEQRHLLDENLKPVEEPGDFTIRVGDLTKVMKVK
jgi:beta-glucosidase